MLGSAKSVGFKTRGESDGAYQYLQNDSIWLYGTMTPQKETIVVMIRGLTSEANTALGA
jgi:hypothetical protein